MLTAAVLVAGQLPGEAPVLSTARDLDGWPRDVAGAISAGSESEVVAAVAAAVAAALILVRRSAAALVVVGSMVAVLLLGPLLKAAVGRPRPEVAPLPADVSEYAFPSGHAAAAAALALATVLAVPAGPRRVLLAALVLVAVATSAAAQLVLGRHHPADLVAGWLLAVACVGCAQAVRRRTGSGAPDAG